MMRRSNPFEEFESMFERMSRQFDEMSRQFDDSRSSWSDARPHWGGSRSHEMEVDVRDGDEEFVVVADLPGFEKEDIDLSVSERALTISASRETEHESDSNDEDGEYIRRERRHESMRRTFGLPGDVRADDASASYKNGVLTVSLPKVTMEDEDSHHIDVE